MFLKFPVEVSVLLILTLAAVSIHLARQPRPAVLMHRYVTDYNPEKENRVKCRASFLSIAFSHIRFSSFLHFVLSTTTSVVVISSCLLSL